MTTNSIDELLYDLLNSLDSLERKIIAKKVFTGFDGFVDKIQKAVVHRNDDEIIFYKTLDEFADRIKSVAGKSGQIEMMTQKIKLGGNAPILANTLGKFGVSTVCLGSLGYPEIHDVFRTMHKNCMLLSALKPGESDAIEFDDGKLILSELSVFDHYNWPAIKNIIGLESIRKIVLESDLLAFVDWVNLPHSSAIWEGVLNDIIKPSEKRDFIFLFDLCDPSKRNNEEIEKVLDLISYFSPYGNVTLGLNENETIKIWEAITETDRNRRPKKVPSVLDAGSLIYKSLNIDSLLIHPVDRTILFHQQEVYELPGRFVTEPEVLTGGGDNLNAGYCLGLLAGLSFHMCMLLGMATSGSYIQNGKSADIQDLKKYLQRWINESELSSENVRSLVGEKVV